MEHFRVVLEKSDLPPHVFEDLLTAYFGYMSEIAGLLPSSVFSDSPYYSLFHKSSEEDYATYKLLNGGVAGLMAFDEFTALLTGTVQQSIELQALMTLAFNNVSLDGALYRADTHGGFQLPMIDPSTTAVCRRAKYRAGIVSQEDDPEAFHGFTLCRGLTWDEIDPIMPYVFQAIKDVGYDWSYRSHFLDEACRAYVQFGDDREKDIYTLFAHANRTVPEAVLAYFDIYGRFPHGYPNELGHYVVI